MRPAESARVGRAKRERILSPAVPPTAREVLNELRWRGANRLPDATLWYADRARAEGFRIILGTEIVELERRYFRTTTARLPYYKIARIVCGGKTVFER